MAKELANKKIFITGLPGVGKTTLIMRLLENMSDFNPSGFYTREIRTNNIRQGFELIGLDGTRSILSHVNIVSRYRVGKYGVDIKAFDKFLDAIDFIDPDNKLILIDEVGKMECLSEKFRCLIETLLTGDKFIIATIASRGDHFIEKIKRHLAVKLFELTPSNREEMPGRILKLIR
jgi:nucleoside-triphosphatase